MFKLLSYPIFFCLFCYGVWLLFAAHQYKEKFEKAKDWTEVEGRIVKKEEGVDLQIYNPASWPKLLVCDPSITFSYRVDGKRYEVTDKLPLCFVFVRIATRGDYDPNSVSEDQEPSFEQMIADSRKLRQQNPNAGTGPDITKHINFDKDGKVQYRGLGTMIKEATPDEDEKDVVRPRVKIKYRPSAVSEAITAKDEIKGDSCIYMSGIWSIIIAVLGAGGLFFHQWVTKPSEEDLNMQFQGKSSIKY